jgi:hypothetical protein
MRLQRVEGEVTIPPGDGAISARDLQGIVVVSTATVPWNDGVSTGCGRVPGDGAIVDALRKHDAE